MFEERVGKVFSGHPPDRLVVADHARNVYLRMIQAHNHNRDAKMFYIVDEIFSVAKDCQDAIAFPATWEGQAFVKGQMPILFLGKTAYAQFLS